MKISDYRLSEYYIRKLCNNLGINFFDLEVCFDSPKPCFENYKICVVPTVASTVPQLAQTLYQIISIYINYIDIIHQKKVNLSQANKNAYLNYVLSVLRAISYGPDMPRDTDNKLNCFPFVWVAMRDIICPLFGRGIKNIDVLVKETPYIDGAKFFDEGEMPGLDQPTIVLNKSVSDRTYITAFLLIEAIIAHKIHIPDVMLQIFNKKEVFDRFDGLFLLTSLKDDESVGFYSILGSLTNTYINVESKVKTAQSIYQNWWYIGLIEKMLESARGIDPTLKQKLNEMTSDLWERVEKHKAKLGLPQLSLEALLRIQSEENEDQPHQTLQGLLSDVRVW